VEPILFGVCISVVKGYLISPSAYDVTHIAATIYPFIGVGVHFFDVDEYSLDRCKIIPNGQIKGFIHWSFLGMVYLI
jgi:hypothetical protein